jgi:hypothetical protein
VGGDGNDRAADTVSTLRNFVPQNLVMTDVANFLPDHSGKDERNQALIKYNNRFP